MRRRQIQLTLAIGLVGVAALLGTRGASGDPKLHPVTRSVLAANGIGPVPFGTATNAAIHRVRLLLGVLPKNPYYPLNVCKIDHATEWPDLIIFFTRGRFVGYAYGHVSKRSRLSRLSITAGLSVGNRLSFGRRLYGDAFRWSLVQGGAWWVTTASGRINGFAGNSPPIGPQSTVQTIEAGNVGCPAMTP